MGARLAQKATSLVLSDLDGFVLGGARDSGPCGFISAHIVSCVRLIEAQMEPVKLTCLFDRVDMFDSWISTLTKLTDGRDTGFGQLVDPTN